MSGIKKAIILCICLTMICSSSLVVLATSDPFKVEWSHFYATKQNGSDPDGLKANRTRAIQALIRECTDEQIHQGIIVDGSFGSNTKAAVQRFQTSVGLDPDGSVGPATWPELYDLIGWTKTYSGGYYRFYCFGMSGGESGGGIEEIIRRGSTSGAWKVYTTGWPTFEYAS